MDDVRTVAPHHARRVIDSDPEYEVGLAGQLRATLNPEARQALLDRFTNTGALAFLRGLAFTFSNAALPPLASNSKAWRKRLVLDCKNILLTPFYLIWLSPTHS